MHSYPTRNFGLDFIRTIAITLVVLSHCTFIFPEFNATLTKAIRLLGATGVDIFFVLSGYLIGGILLRNLNSEKISLKNLFHFWKRRWLRTLPNYFIVFTLNVLVILMLNENLSDDIWRYLLFIQNFTASHPNFFTEAWSLSIEEFAYLILPFFIYSCLSVFRKINTSKVFIVSTITVIGILFLFKIRFFYSVEIESYQSWSSQFRKVVLYRLDAIYYGFILVYLMSKYNFFKTYKNVLLITGVISFILLHACIVALKITPENYRLFFSVLYLPLVSLSIALLFPWFIELKSKPKIVEFVTYVSKRSYSIYLVNYSLILLTLQYFFSASFFTVLIYLGATLVSAEVLYQIVEQPFLRLRKRIAPRK